MLYAVAASNTHASFAKIIQERVRRLVTSATGFLNPDMVDSSSSWRHGKTKFCRQVRQQ